VTATGLTLTLTLCEKDIGKLVKIKMAAIALMTVLVGCSGPRVKEHQGSISESLSLTHQVWESPAAEYPTMCMIFQSDGTLTFRGGFAFYNPSKWRNDINTGEVVITIGGVTPFPSEVLKQALSKKIGALVGYEENGRKIIYKIDASTEFIDFVDFHFYPSDSCHATEASDAIEH
jgi:hypothetical protein